MGNQGEQPYHCTDHRPGRSCERYTQTVTALLSAAGLDVRTPDEHLPGALEVHNRGIGLTIELDLCEDRSAQWHLTAGDEIPQITRLLHASTPPTR